MTSESCATPKMIVQYEWILENVEEEPKTFATKMILFRGERVFRVGLKNLVKSPVLFLMAINVNKMGMKVEEVMYGTRDSGISPAIMSPLTQEKIGDDGNLQLFKTNFDKQIVGNCTFVFRICIEGSVPGYSYRLSDRLAKDQLWDTAILKSSHLVDVEFVVKDKTFHSHKAILAARSPVFAAEFTKEQSEDPHQIRIDGVEPSTVKQFLHFIYTGEPMGTLVNEDLLKLADQYQLSTLASLCRVALEKIKPMQMVNLMKNVNKDAEKPSNIRPDKETEIFFDRTTPTFRCTMYEEDGSKTSKCVMTYQNEEVFFAYITGNIVWNRSYSKCVIQQPVFHCSCAQHRSFGLIVEDIYCSPISLQQVNWFKMESKFFQKNAELLHFTTHLGNWLNYECNTEVRFDIKVISNVGNYYYEMMDEDWIKDFWIAATNQILTDVGIFVGTVKVMEVHRVILSARSPVLNESLSKVTNTGKSIVTFGAEFDVEIVKHFLKFLYTALLETSDVKKQLLELATMYKVETLKIMCQLANRDPPDVEDLTNSLLEL